MNSFLQFSSAEDISETLDISEATKRYAEEQLSLPPGVEPKFQRKDFNGLASLGLCGMSTPDEFGGNSVSSLTIASVLFEIAKCQLGPAIYLSVHLMVARLLTQAVRGLPDGKPELEILKHVAEGRKMGAFCLTEASAGSDAANLQTKARLADGTWRIEGEKIYITSAGHADLYYVFARTSDSAKDGISAFLVEKGAEGLSFGPEEEKMGCSSSPIASVKFQNTPGILLGEPGKGYKAALKALAGGRANIAACACALGAKAIARATEHLKTRKQFGQPLSEFQGLQFLLSDMLMKHRASILLTRDACRAIDRDEDTAMHAAVAKCFATDSAMSVCTDAVQLLGGAGYLKEYEVERLMRDAKMLQIVEGTNQIQRMILSRNFLQA